MLVSYSCVSAGHAYLFIQHLLHCVCMAKILKVCKEIVNTLFYQQFSTHTSHYQLHNICLDGVTHFIGVVILFCS